MLNNDSFVNGPDYEYYQQAEQELDEIDDLNNKMKRELDLHQE